MIELPVVNADGYEVQTSSLDASVNFIQTLPEDANSKFEARYVRRTDDYFIVYLSSQSGCNKACRFCHLTQTGQTKGIDADLASYLEQAEQVFGHYDTELAAARIPAARVVHFNFMSRGEVFANQYVLNGGGDRLCQELNAKAVTRDLLPKLKFSSIFPKELETKELTDIFPIAKPDIYYSLYSLDPDFRKRWLPKALDPELSLQKLLRYQDDTNKVVNLHWAFIAGENDDEQTVVDICERVNDLRLAVNVNIVRYNPFSSAQGQEPSEEVLLRNEQIFKDVLPDTSRVQVVSRVGFDVKASCGMFVGGRADKLAKAGS